MSTWTIYISTMGWVEARDLGISQLRRRLVAHGQDSVEFTVNSATALTDADLIPYGTEVQIRKDNVPWFTGRVVTLPRQGDATGERRSYRVVGPWWYLANCIYRQEYNLYESGVQGQAKKARVVLCQSKTGSRIKSGAQIRDVLSYCIDRGAPFQIGTIDDGIYLPFDERTNITCADAIDTMMRWLPDYVAWVDYSVDPPAYHCRARANLTAATVAMTALSGTGLAITPRYDLQVPGIEITYEIQHSENGKVYSAVVRDTAGDTTAFGAVFTNFELQGRTTTIQRQSIETEDMPNDVGFNDSIWWKARVPELEKIQDGDITMTYTERSSSLPRRLVKGTIQDWMELEAEDCHITATARIRVRDAWGNLMREMRNVPVHFDCVATNAQTQDYTKTTTITQAEPVPVGVAQSLMAAWSTLQYEGSLQTTEDEPAGVLVPGKRLRISGGRPEWGAMDALIQETSEDVDNGTTAVTFGPARVLEANTLVGLFRAARSRRAVKSTADRETGEEQGESSVDMSGPAPKAAAGVGEGETRMLNIRNSDPWGFNHELVFDPTVMAFGDAANRRAVMIQTREITVPRIGDDGKLYLQKRQILCSDGYGTEEEAPTGGSDDPSTDPRPTETTVDPSGNSYERHFENGAWGPWHPADWPNPQDPDPTQWNPDTTPFVGRYDGAGFESLAFRVTISPAWEPGQVGITLSTASGHNGKWSGLMMMNRSGTGWYSAFSLVGSCGVSLAWSGSGWVGSGYVATGHVGMSSGPLAKALITHEEGKLPSGMFGGGACGSHLPGYDHSDFKYSMQVIYGPAAALVGDGSHM